MGSLFSGKTLLLRRKISSFFFKLRHLREKLRDQVNGLDFASSMSREQAGIDNLEDTVHYGSTGFAPELNDALKYLQVNPQDAILDYGSGKGAALVTFSKFPFGKIAGIELSESLVQICKSNLNKLQLNNIDVIHSNATNYNNIDTFSIFYFANPFTGQIFKSVIDNILASIDRKSREVYIVYYNPKCHDIIMDTGRFKLSKQFNYGARRLFIYKLDR